METNDRNISFPSIALIKRFTVGISLFECSSGKLTANSACLTGFLPSLLPVEFPFQSAVRSGGWTRGWLYGTAKTYLYILLVEHLTMAERCSRQNDRSVNLRAHACIPLAIARRRFITAAKRKGQQKCDKLNAVTISCRGDDLVWVHSKMFITKLPCNFTADREDCLVLKRFLLFKGASRRGEENFSLNRKEQSLPESFPAHLMESLSLSFSRAHRDLGK